MKKFLCFSSSFIILIFFLFCYELCATTTMMTELKEVLMIAGNFSLNGELTNLAQYDISSGIWSNNYDAELYVYGESSGVIWDVVVNRTTPSNELIVVGAFDTVSKMSQVQYCGVGVWTGISFNKVGEGLCPRGGATNSAILIHTLVLGDHGDLFVGGSFDSRVWNGKEFVDIHDLAYYRGSRAAWLPVEGGRLLCDSNKSPGCVPRVSALEWDPTLQVLYIGGRFDMIDEKNIPGGVCMWTEATGLIPFEGIETGLGLSPDLPNGEVTSLVYEPKSRSLFVAGSFYYVNGAPCTSVAVWNRYHRKWSCLYEESKGISTVTAMTYDSISRKLYLAGWAASKAQWPGNEWGSPYAISVADLTNYIGQLDPNPQTESPTPSTASKDSSGRSRTRKFFHPRQRYLKSDSLILRQSQFANITQKSRRKFVSSFFYFNAGRISSKQEIFQNFLQDNLTQFHRVAKTHTSRHLLSIDLDWSWLPGFSGGNGPIFGLAPGRGTYKDCLFIAGAFNNGPPIVLWIPASSSSAGSVVPLGAKNDGINGLITSVAQLVIQVPRTNPPDIPLGPVQLMSWTTWIFLLICILLGIVLGALFAVRCRRSSPTSIPAEGDQGITDDTTQIPLVALGGRDDIDLQQCFRNALKSRHLTHCDNLQVIPTDEVVLQNVIGEGTFGRVWCALRRNSDVAVKEFAFAQAAISGGSQQINELVEEIIGEACVMSCLRHPKILTLYGVSLTGQALWIVCELCEKGSLRMILNDPRMELSYAQKLSFCLDIADGMMYLHQRKHPIIHRDLKSHNIFIVETSPGKLIAKIGDWGSARVIALSNERSLTQGVGTACWLSPEVILNAQYSKASDVYAFGIVLWEVYTRQDVYPRLSAPQIIARVANEGLRPTIPYNCPWEELMKSCWNQNPSSRPPFGKVITILAEMYGKLPKQDNNNKSNTTPGVIEEK